MQASSLVLLLDT